MANAESPRTPHMTITGNLVYLRMVIQIIPNLNVKYSIRLKTNSYVSIFLR